MIIIDIGCGTNKYSGAIGIDKIKLKNVDIICDVEHGIPFKNNTIDYIYSRHFLEHITNLESVVKEMHRVMKSNGIVNITVPHFSNTLGYSDPTHKRFFGYYTFDYFCPDIFQGRRHVPAYYTGYKFKIICKKIEFNQYKYFTKIFNTLFNSTEMITQFYETYLSFILPCYQVSYTLTPIK